MEEGQAADIAAPTASDSTSPAIDAWVAHLPASDHSSVVALAPYLTDRDVAERFQFGIEILQHGLEARLAGAAAAGHAADEGAGSAR